MSARIHVLRREMILPRPRREIFAFFADAANLETLTPPELRFEILTPLPIVMRPGALIDYRLGLHGVPFRWRTLIDSFEPETRFIDTQLRGPYASWRHLHEFEDVPGGTLARDRVEYSLPLGPLGTVAHVLMVKRQLRAIFGYRQQVMRERFTPRHGAEASKPEREDRPAS